MANVVEVEVENGDYTFHCPVCGISVIGGEGYAEPECGHIRFFVDWIGEFWTPKDSLFDAKAKETQDRIRKQWKDVADSREDSVKALARLLPETAFVVNLVEPARGGGHDGSVVFVGIDFASGVRNISPGHRALDVVGTTGGKVTLETTRQTAEPNVAAKKGVKQRRGAAPKAARKRNRRIAPAKKSKT